jgi:hypothetical protein
MPARTVRRGGIDSIKFRSYNSQMRRFMLFVLASVALGQDLPCDPGWKRIPNGGCERDATAEPTKAAQVPVVVDLESAEHKYARLRYVRTSQVQAENRAQVRAILDEVNRLQNKRWGSDPDKQLAMLAQARTLQNLQSRLDAEVHRAMSQMQYADDCAAVFRQTIDKKNGDLTTRETELIGSCKALDQYPPAK